MGNSQKKMLSLHSSTLPKRPHFAVSAVNRIYSCLRSLLVAEELSRTNSTSPLAGAGGSSPDSYLAATGLSAHRSGLAVEELYDGSPNGVGGHPAFERAPYPHSLKVRGEVTLSRAVMQFAHVDPRLTAPL